MNDVLYHQVLFITGHVLNITSIVGILLNFMSILTLLNGPMRHKKFTLYHTALTMWDSILILAAWPTFGLNAIMFRGKFKPINHWAPTAHISYVIMNIAMNACIFLTVTATYERYVAITTPMKRIIGNSWKRIGASLSGASVIYNLPKIWEFRHKMSPSRNLTILLRSPIRHDLYYCILYRLLCDIVASVLPIVLVVFVGISIIQSVQKSKRFYRDFRSEDVQRGGLTTRHISYSDDIRRFVINALAAAPRTGSSHSAGSNTAVFVAWYMTKFTLAYSCPTVCNLVELLKEVDIKVHLRYFVLIGNFLVVLNSSTNFFLYVFFCPEFRTNFRRISGMVNIYDLKYFSRFRKKDNDFGVTYLNIRRQLVMTQFQSGMDKAAVVEV